MNANKQNRLKIVIPNRPIDHLELFHFLDFIFEENPNKGEFEVFLPIDWTLRASRTQDKVYLVDQLGRKRGYYTTKSVSKNPICLLSRYTIETEVVSYKESGMVKETRFVINDNATGMICYVGQTIDLYENSGILKDEIQNVEAYLDTHYPDSKNILAYWG
jgi:hypothetical protein